jgi:hypothetical protein
VLTCCLKFCTLSLSKFGRTFGCKPLVSCQEQAVVQGNMFWRAMQGASRVCSNNRD